VNPGEIPDFFEEAFAKIEPKSEEESERLAKMREAFRKIRAESMAEIAKLRFDETAEEDPSRSVGSMIIEQARIYEEAKDALGSALGEQADWIERIATVARER